MYVGTRVFSDDCAMVALRMRLSRSCVNVCPTKLSPSLRALIAQQQQLLGADADPNEERLSDGRSPLSIAASQTSSSRSVAIVRSLLQAGADAQAFCRSGLLPIHRSCSAAGDGGVVHELLKAGTSVNALAPGLGFLTPLHFAARSGHAEAVRALLSVEGCSFNKKEDGSG